MKYKVTRHIYKHIIVEANGEADASMKADQAEVDAWAEEPDYSERILVLDCTPRISRG